MPQDIGLWEGKSLEVDEKSQQVLEADDVTLMEYRMGKEPPVWLARVTGFDNRATFHPPELCYVGSHFEIIEREIITVMANAKTHRLMRLVIAQKGEQFESWYWFTANGRVTPSYYAQQIWLVLDTLRRSPTSGMLVRISTPLDDPHTTRRRLLAFLTSFDTQHPSTQAPSAHGA